MNRQVRLKSRPSGIPEAEHFEIVEAPVPDPSDGQVLVRNIYVSVDPAMRGWVSAVANYSDAVALGAVMRSVAVGRVEESRGSDFHPGDYVLGMFGWQDFAVVDAEAIERKVGGSGLPISTSLGVLGISCHGPRLLSNSRERMAHLPLRLHPPIVAVVPDSYLRVHRRTFPRGPTR